MGLDVVAAGLADVLHERLQVVAAEIFGATAMPAYQQMLVSTHRRHIRMAAIWLVHALNQARFFQFLQRAIDRRQAQAGVGGSRQVVNLGGRQRSLRLDQHGYHCAQRVRQTIPLIVKHLQPGMRCHAHCAKLIMINIFNNNTFANLGRIKAGMGIVYPAQARNSLKNRTQ